MKLIKKYLTVILVSVFTLSSVVNLNAAELDDNYLPEENFNGFTKVMANDLSQEELSNILAKYFYWLQLYDDFFPEDSIVYFYLDSLNVKNSLIVIAFITLEEDKLSQEVVGGTRMIGEVIWWQFDVIGWGMNFPPTLWHSEIVIDSRGAHVFAGHLPLIGVVHSVLGNTSIGSYAGWLTYSGMAWPSR